MKREIIAIIDTIAQDIAGPVVLFRHDAAAVRYFSDIATDPQTMIHRHVSDYDLVSLGQLDDQTFTITPQLRVIITGYQWREAQPPVTEPPNSGGA